jgi:transposase
MGFFYILPIKIALVFLVTKLKGCCSSDFMVDSLIDFWKTYGFRFPKIKKLLINLDNGGENSSRRTQFMKRIVEFVDETGIEIELVYYPPYHSKYNPIERV